MSTKVAELNKWLKQDDAAAWVSNLWTAFNNQRREKIEEWKELRNYVFATDTTTTTNQTLPWKNSTTLPKLCQIRDNLHSNYLSALFPNDDWLRWEAYSKDDGTKKKTQAIEAYMKNKTREGHFRTEMSKLLLDYIDYGNAFATVDFSAQYREDPTTGQRIAGFIGPRVFRISPLDIVFDPTAATFDESFKIIRSIKTVGEIQKMAEEWPENAFYASYTARRATMRKVLGGYSIEDFDKAEGYSVDGFGNLYEYYQSDYVEILEFYGDYHSTETGELKSNVVITVFDRCHVVREEPIKSYFGKAPVCHVGWRMRPDNLWAMGPLDNLVGMQYRIDHLENLKADAMDLCVHPPLVITGEVEEFVWGPGAEIHTDENGNVSELGKNLNGIIAASNEIHTIEEKMELYSGAPREAMGIRTAGEKTAFEVQSLQNAAGRIFQEKITSFEIELLEPILNAMLESARRNMETFDVVRVLDDDLAVQSFLSVTKDDITGSGKIRPVGARHYASQAQLVQNLSMMFNGPMAEVVAPHLSSIQLTKLLEDVLGLERYNLFKPNAAIFEQQETQRLVNQAQEDLQMEAAVPQGITS